VHHGRSPQGGKALEIATARNKPESTLLFLPASDFAALADEIRGKNNAWKRKGPRDRQLFFTDGTYSCITVTRLAGPPVTFQSGDLEVSRLQFAVKEVGSFRIDTIKMNVYAIGHLEVADAVGNTVDPDDSDDEAASHSEDEG
jgi:hypothetical protein